MSKPPFYDLILSLAEVEVLREAVDLFEDLLDAVDAQDMTAQDEE